MNIFRGLIRGSSGPSPFRRSPAAKRRSSPRVGKIQEGSRHSRWRLQGRWRILRQACEQGRRYVSALHKAVAGSRQKPRSYQPLRTLDSRYRLRVGRQDEQTPAQCEVVFDLRCRTMTGGACRKVRVRSTAALGTRGICSSAISATNVPHHPQALGSPRPGSRDADPCPWSITLSRPSRAAAM
jgi:hypothetical protein